jgi:hypothetical protein
LTLVCLLALATIPTYMSGNLARQTLASTVDGAPSALIDLHQGAALLALAAIQIVGGFAWVGLWQARRGSRVPPATLYTVLFCALITFGLLAITGNTGGAIRHPEILSGNEVPSALGALGIQIFTTVQYIVTGSSMWYWPILETLHFLGLAMLVAATGVLHIRLLGFWKEMPVAPLWRFLPWGAAGLAINIVTGMAFFVGMPYFYVTNADFLVKIVAVTLAGASLVVFTTDAFRNCEWLEKGQEAPPLTKLVAGAALILWIAVIVTGRYMPMFEETLNANSGPADSLSR